MSLRDTIRVIQPGRRRLKVFVDFWNVLINARSQTSDRFPLDIRWDKLASLLVAETQSGTNDESKGDLAGCYIFGSFRRSNPDDQKFVDSVLEDYGSCSGLYFDFKERLKKDTSVRCKSCNTPVSISSEAGVDVLLTVEMVKHATMRDHDYLALVSNDRDFIPLLSYLRDQGQRVIHASTTSTQLEMRSLTWKQVDLVPLYPEICKVAHNDCVIFTRPGYEERVSQAKILAEEAELETRVVNVCEASEISDRDFKFLIKNLRQMSFSLKENKSAVYGRPGLLDDMHAFRSKLISGEIDGAFPFVMREGRLEACGNSQHGWMVMATLETPNWKSLGWRRFQTGSALGVT